jgi:hypothetical protein
MLRKDVVESVRAGTFHIYAVETVDQAIELLTGAPAGERSSDGSYPAGSINSRVDARLKEMGEAMRRFGRRPDAGRDGRDGARDGDQKADEPQEENREE